MARIVVIGPALQNIYMIDHDDLKPTAIGEAAIFGKVLVGKSVEIDKAEYSVSGSGLNAAITLARRGHEVILLSNIGRDAAGEAILSVTDREEIDNSYMGIIPNHATGTSVTLLDSKSGAETVLTHHGISRRFGNFAAHDLELAQPDWLLTNSIGGDLEKATELFNKAHEMGIKVMFRPGAEDFRDKNALLKSLAKVDILMLGKKQASELVPGAVLKELLYHLNNYVKTVIITDGAMGGIAGSREHEEIYRFGIYEDVKVRDHTGAGDAFAAGFLAHYCTKKSLRAALIFASANATSVVKKIGATSGVLTGSVTLHPMPIQKL